MPKQYPRDFRERAVRLVNETAGDHEAEWVAIRRGSPIPPHGHPQLIWPSSREVPVHQVTTDSNTNDVPFPGILPRQPRQA
jgi:hypothetical protein